VLFSSITGAMGNFGQSDYAYGNSFMDYFAGRRERLRLNGLRYGQTVSINWPLWAEGGMRVDQQTRKMLTKTMGTDVLDTKSGLKAFEFALQTNCNQLLVAKGNPEYIKEKMGLVRQEVRKIDAGIVTEENKERIIQNIENELAKFISEVLKIQEKDLEMDENFNNFGFDSISITEITNLINERFNLEITPANFYEHATVQAFSENLYKENTEAFIQFYNGIVGQGNEDKKVICVKRDDENYEIHQNRQTRFYSEKSAPVEKTKGKESVAIIGMSGRMAQSEDLKMFWEHLRQGNDLITEIPKDRWDWQDYYGDAQEGGSKTTVKWGGFIEDIDKFDAELFGISPHEAKLMDPQQRIFLETVWRTIEDAGYKVSDFSETKTGVFVGVSNMDYYELLNEVQEEVQAHITTGNAHSIIANRISFLLNTHGPSEPINTACSSSLVAIHRAVEVIRSGSCDMAIAGGVNAIISPKLHVAFDKAGMLSLNGCCRTFDKSANGYARGEGVGAVLLKSLSKAEADGDHIYAVIRGSAINHCGRTNSLTAPNPNAQADVIIEAIEDAKVDPANITYIEAHGTGTSLGDPIEINGLKKAFSELFRRRGAPLPKRPYCTIGSVKTNIGHLESAAGIAGIFKAVLAMKYGQIPKNVHFKELNPYIDLKESPFYIAEKTKDWEVLKDKEGHEIPRVCGVSSFGFGGVNAHVILEDYRTDSEGKSTSSASDSQLFILSAKSHEMLRQYAKNILGELNHLANTVNCEKDKDIIFVNMQNALLDIVAGCLQVKRSELSAREELTDYGFDQVALIGLANAINERYGTDIEYDTLLAYPSIEVLIPHLYDRYQEMFTVQNENAVFKTDKSSAAGISIANLCYTLQVGREPMKSRIAAVVTDLKELMKKLNLYLEGRQDISEFYSNETGNNGFATDLLFNGKEGKEYLNSLMKGKQATKFAQLWTYGANIDWNALYDSGARQRISLQAYPFARKSFWVPIKKQRVTLPGKQSVKTIANQPELKSQLGNGKEEKDKVRDILASVLSLAAEEIDENAEFMSIGLDSIFGIKLIKELKKEFGFDINPLVVIENPTIRQLANHIIFARDNKNNFQSEQVAAVKEELTDKNSPAAGVKDRLAGILAEILSLATGGIDGEAEFSALGLDSILAIKLTKRLNKEFSFEINPVKIIENPTLNRLSKAVSAELSE
jgi:3-oxoacyl-(acyl-carrier-protein) synthase/acyl carrier protein